MNELAVETAQKSIEVKTYSTAGAYPDGSYAKVPPHQPIRHELNKAAKASCYRKDAFYRLEFV